VSELPAIEVFRHFHQIHKVGYFLPQQGADSMFQRSILMGKNMSMLIST